MRIRFSFILSGLVLLCFALHAQNRPIGTWRMYLPYRTSNDIAVSNEEVFSSSGNALLRFNKEDHAVSKIDKADGLSDMKINNLAYDTATKNLLICYDNSNIDMLNSKNEIINLNEIKDKVISGNKRIYNICFHDHFAYLGTGFGVQVIDLDRMEFKETYVVGRGGGNIRVNDVAILNNKIYAATIEGIKFIDINNPGILNYNFWTSLSGAGMPGSTPDIMESFAGKLYTVFNDSLWSYDGSTWNFISWQQYWTAMQLTSYSNNLVLTQQGDSSGTFLGSRALFIDASGSIAITSHPRLSHAKNCIEDYDGNIWWADLWQGLLRTKGSEFESIYLNGPGTASSFRMAVNNNIVYVAAGAYNNSLQFTFNRDGFFVMKDNWWNTYNENNDARLKDYLDIVAVGPDPYSDKVYFSSYLNGLVIFENGNITTYNKDNSPLKNTTADPLRTKVSDTKVDDYGNAWILNFGSDHPIVVRKPTGEWIPLQGIPGLVGVKKVMIDSYGQKWISLKGSGGGIMVYYEGDDVDNTSDDVVRQLTTARGNGALPEENVNTMVEDKEGNVWVGTNQGIGVFYCPTSVLRDGCDAQKIIVNRDGYNGYLFETQFVKTIAVDGANRKWVGTSNGVWLISADGKEEILRFDITNSPLPSNEIYDITINQQTGEVFIATEGGIVSYMGDATTGGEKHEDVMVYPNPVRPEYTGTIAVKGLVDDANIKITDVGGGLIWQGKALGGQAVWNGNNYNGQRAKSGVYLVFSLSNDGKQHYCAKIVLLK